METTLMAEPFNQLRYLLYGAMTVKEFSVQREEWRIPVSGLTLAAVKNPSRQTEASAASLGSYV
jgi:hypothetical protein